MGLKILMFGWEFPPFNSGGLGVACYGLARSLARRGARLTFVLPKKMPISADFMEVAFASETGSISMRRVDAFLYPYLTSSRYATERRGKTPAYGLSLFEEVERYALLAKDIASQNPHDIIHAHDWLSFKAGISARDISGKPLILHVHATEFDRTGGNGANPTVFKIEKESLEKADGVVTVSAFTKNQLIRYYGIPAEKITVIHNGIDEEDHHGHSTTISRLEKLKEAGNRVVLFAGRLTLQKGPDHFITAAHRVLQYRPDTVFLVAGAGDMERQCMQYAAYMGIGDKVLFTGFLRNEELRDAYRAADVFVMPSVSEPFGISALEAMLHGTPVIVSKQSGVIEAATNILKTNFWDIEEMTDKILAVLESPALRTHIAECAKREIPRLSWNTAAEKCINYYNQFVNA